MKRLFFIATMVVACWLMASDAKPPVEAQGNSNPGVLPPNSHAFGRSYGEWSAAAWQYLLAIPASVNPALDNTGVNCGVGQTGRVFFLAGPPGPVTLTCAAPVGKPIFFALIAVECSTVEPAPFFGINEAELRACAKGLMDTVGVETLKATIDGVELRFLNRYRVQSPLFAFTMLAQDNLLGLPGVTSGMSVSDGYWLMLHPLSRGNHTLHFEATVTSGPFAGFFSNATYHLTVR
jgi:hypothetical protein